MTEALARLGPSSLIQLGDDLTLGERKARHREEHLCLRCSHQQVCGMAKALDPDLLVAIASCLGFAPDAGEDVDAVCELTPVEPLIPT